MDIDRRRFLHLSAAAGTMGAAGAAAAAPANAPTSAFGVDAGQFGVHAGSTDDQTNALQRAIDAAAGTRSRLGIAPGTYRVGNLRLPAGTQIYGVRGATRLVFTQGASLISAARADGITLSGLVLDGGNRPLPDGRGLVHLSSSRSVRIRDCDVIASSRIGIRLESIEGEVAGNTVSQAATACIMSVDARGLTIAGNVIRNGGNNGILVWRSQAGNDGTMVIDNRIEEIAAKAGGSGQNGNAINVFRAGNVTVRGNRISGAAFSAVRGNAAANLQITGNVCTGLGEVALYAEFGFEGAVIANNSVDGAAIGIAVTNFNAGGRLAVVQGNLIRNLVSKRPAGTDPNDLAGVGIGVEADSAVTGNVIENAPYAGIAVGWGQYLRDVTVTGNVVRKAGIGISVSVAPGAGNAVIADNLLADTTRGAIVGTDRHKLVTGDLARDGAARYAQLAISGNRVR